ncbi:hypothetical protein NEMIN01_1205 [Nematocida minor]|uniref:uncharacterized protein n=1 Tax=Nematocida minor TaxID=1912983 RepID=UPI0022211CD0|nr:uncharacterized protein NEMIN01_1205 [Nematocida minor]KAI5190803.1 hypothetical protein NEMIN01_1205 [Nematocida minor]
MFQAGTETQTKHENKQKTGDRLAQSTLLFDELVVSISALELARCSFALSRHLVDLFVCCVVVWPYRKYLQPNEVFAVLGAVRWIFRKTEIPTELFFSLGIQHKSMPIGCSLKHMAVYGLRELFTDVKTLSGIVAWAGGALYALVSIGVLCVLFRFEVSVNVKRKFFHWALFLYYSIFPARIARTQSVCLLFLVQLGLKLLESYGHFFNVDGKSMLSGLTSEKDRRGVISHVLLLAGFLFSIDGIRKDRKRLFFVLSSVGIVDGISCFFPKSKNTHKSKIGSCVGAVVAKAILSLFFQADYPLWMYLFVGMGEYCAHMNDNILLLVIAHGVTHRDSGFQKIEKVHMS